MLERMVVQLRSTEPILGNKNWEESLLAGEREVVKRTYLLFLPPETGEPQAPAIIPFDVLNSQWRAWWETFTAAVVPNFKPFCAKSIALSKIFVGSHC
jgi:hypothetical protein